MSFRLALVILAGCVAVSGCKSDGGKADGGADSMSAADEHSFESPRAAVPHISRMLRDQSWAELARYYDLSDSQLTHDDLASGSFFFDINTNAERLPPPENELARYRHPFHPASVFDHVSETNNPNEVIVTVRLDIDQGTGMPPRSTLDSFRMRRVNGGWKILPDEVNAN